ncbi:MAG: TolB family protein [Planctomycetota bacterium]
MRNILLPVILAAGLVFSGVSCRKKKDKPVIWCPYEFSTEVFPSRYDYIAQGDGFSFDVFPVEVVDTANWNAATLERLPAPIRSAGIEDAPFITPDGNTLYFTFIGNAAHTPFEQISDPTVGIYVSHFDGADWSEPEKLGLVPDGVQALCGGGSIKRGDEFWFNMAGDATGWSVFSYVAYMWNGQLSIGYDPGAPVNMPGVSAGEPEISSDGNRLYINSAGLGGYGSDDIFYFDRIDGEWQGPYNIGAVINNANQQNRPFITEDGLHLYFDSFEGATGTGISIFRSDWTGTEWGTPVEIVRNNLGEPALTGDGEWLYFTHFYYDAGFNRYEADLFRVRRMQ